MPRKPTYETDANNPHSNDYGIHLLVGAKGPRAWKVTLYRHGKTLNRLFSFSRYGGKTKAREAADACRNELMLTNRPKSGREVRQRLISTNTSGHPGVHYRCYTGVAYWVARTTLRNGGSVTKSFRVEHYGEERAKQLAIQERERQLDNLGDYHSFKMPNGERLFERLLDEGDTGKRKPRQQAKR